MNVKANQHYRKTHRDICEAFIKLLEQKDLKDISVAEICRELNISRGTFYEHFTDVYDLMEKIDESMAEGIKKRYDEAIKISFRSALLEIFRYVEENRIFYSIYLDEGRTLHFEKDLSFDDALFSQHLHTPSIRMSKTELYYHEELFRSEIRTLLRCWLGRNCKESPENLFEILMQQYRYSQMAVSGV